MTRNLILAICSFWLMLAASGCYNRYTVHGDSPAGIPTIVAESTPFSSTYDVDVTPALTAEERCHQRAPHDGGTYIWLTAQNMCYFQSTAGDVAAGLTAGGYGGYGGIGAYGGVGYGAYGGYRAPSVGVPGIR